MVWQFVRSSNPNPPTVNVEGWLQKLADMRWGHKRLDPVPGCQTLISSVAVQTSGSVLHGYE